MTHCRIKKHPPQTKRGGCFFVFGKNFNLMTLPAGVLLFLRALQRAEILQPERAASVPAPCRGQRGHSLSQKRVAPLEPQEKGLDWQSRARMTFVPPEWKCLRGGIASLAANGSARRFASAPIIRCRSAYLVGVQPNFRLPPVSTMRRAQQCRIRQAVCRHATVTHASR